MDSQGFLAISAGALHLEGLAEFCAAFVALLHADLGHAPRMAHFEGKTQGRLGSTVDFLDMDMK